MTATLSRPAAPATVSGATVELRDPSNALIGSAITCEAGIQHVTVSPDTALAPLTDYTVRVLGGASGIKDLQGSALAADCVGAFRTAAAASTPVVAYAFSETGGLTTADASGDHNTARLHNDVAWAPGKFTTGLSFDGAGDTPPRRRHRHTLLDGVVHLRAMDPSNQ